MQRRSNGYRARAIKRSIDLMVALPGVVVVGVLAPWVSVANRLTGDAGPVFFLATRVGQRGRRFRILKFRTMHAADGPGITFRDDPRVTRVGRFLRRTKLDELPQLFNVLRGEMTLVGPRPESPEYVDWSDPIQRVVIDLKPGITGPSQLAYLHEEEALLDDLQYRSVVLPRKLSMDHAYAKHASPRRDLKIILATLRALLHPAFRAD
jgi:lipopolysaccharide/colanic/teichoic acid biosynthesis glycosyltransferase